MNCVCPGNVLAARIASKAVANPSVTIARLMPRRRSAGPGADPGEGELAQRDHAGAAFDHAEAEQVDRGDHDGGGEIDPVARQHADRDAASGKQGHDDDGG